MSRKPASSSSTGVVFRLRGRVAGAERTFLLSPGRHGVGSSATSQLILAVAGVSRRHARLRCEDGAVAVEDLGSRNGTFVNGRRTERGPVGVGDVVRFGPVKLRLEEIDESDVRLGVTLRPASFEETTPYLEETTGLVGTQASEAEAVLADLVFPHDCVAGRSPAMTRFYRALRSLAQSDLPVLIEGETGVGKEFAARTLHLSSKRRQGPFVPINCAAIPAELLEAELFGVGDGVATGVRQRPGRFREAEGGTLLLDEIAELPLPLQAKLLRALQEKEIQPLGRRAVPVDVRGIAATNLELLKRVEQGDFRRDLYYRVAGGVLRVPALRERTDDIPPLVEHFLRAAADKAGKSILGVTVRALDTLQAYAWPGNVRELEHEVERLAHLCADRQAIESALLGERFADREAGVPASAIEPETSPDDSGPGELRSFRLADHVRATERRVIRGALEHAGGSQRRAAKLLGISRTTLARKIAKLGIPTGRRVGG